MAEYIGLCLQNTGTVWLQVESVVTELMHFPANAVFAVYACYNMHVSEPSIPYLPCVSGTTCMCQNWVFLTFYMCLVQRACVRTEYSLLSTRVWCMCQNWVFLTFHTCQVQHVCVRTEYSLLSTHVWYNVRVSEPSIPSLPCVSVQCPCVPTKSHSMHTVRH